MTPSLSLRTIRIETLRSILGYVVRDAYLGVGTEEFAIRAREQWKYHGQGQSWQGEARRLCVTATAIEIRAAIAILEAIDDVDYAAATINLPLSYWGIAPAAIGPYAHARGLEGREWYERFDGFGSYHMDGGRGPGMGGWAWYRIGGDERLTYEDLLPILGAPLANDQGAAKYASRAEVRP